ncbi:serine/threonine-protein kinase PITSLRE isoform X2 [Agrilus planipennis]|uniref:cyclin-dependent kinase n=1 Tax=Agrilus planipennis TaxID=224129 RepID=A0A7F5RK09_AGRPL|nr:serine/threonine-protein kinase PITSLRE isoform X2 [Agrilus planipennis]
MSTHDSGDEQSEDGELRQSPIDGKHIKNDVMDFSLSEEDGEAADSLDIKPPQARVQLSSRKRRDHEGRHKRDRHREERSHSYREKHHREKHLRSAKERESYHREKERYYREKQNYENYLEMQYATERGYRERKDERSNRHPETRKYDEKKTKEKEQRHVGRESEKHRRERHGEERKVKSAGDRALEDLRERLLSKRSKAEDEYKTEKDSHKDKSKQKDSENIETALQGEAGMYVKEIINFSTDEKRHKKDEKHKEEDKLTEEERAEQEMRRVKLLEAEREMARQKEQSRLERERRHLEKTKRKLEEDLHYSKRIRSEPDQVVMISDNSEDEEEEEMETEYVEDEDDEKSVKSACSDVGSSSARSQNSEMSEKSRSRSRTQTPSRSRSRSRSSREDSAPSDRRSLSRSVSRERSASTSPKSNGKTDVKVSDTEEEPKDEEKKKIDFDDDLPPYYPALQGCRSVEEFQCLNRIEEGTYGVVYRARDKRTEEIVALKRLKMEKEKEGFPITSLREINTLLKGQHPNIVTVREIVVGSNMDKIFIVMDYVEHDLKSLMETMRHKKQSFTPGEVKCLLKQLLSAVSHLHDNWILHRDLKTSNLLLSHKGILKVGDFGLAREYGSPLKQYTPIVVTLWYRAPELLLCTKEYSTPIDMWSVGCIFGELLSMNAIFPGKSEVDQLNRIFKDLGTPNEKIWPGFNKLPAVQKMKFTEYPVSNLRTRFHMLSELGQALLQRFLTYDPVQRVTAEDALQHSWFTETPLPIDPSMFPTWPAKSELGHRRALAASPKPPSGGREFKELGGDGEDSLGFRISGTVIENRRMPMGGGFSLKF